MNKNIIRKIVAMMCVAATLFTGCGQAVAGKLVDPPAVDVNPLESWGTTVVLTDEKAGTVLEKENLGSHSVTVSIPKMDMEMADRLNDFEVYCLEVYYHRNDDARLQPAFPEEPEASAVYYFIPREVCPDGIAQISWHDTKGETSLCWGTSLTQPAVYLMKMVVNCQKDDSGAVDTIYTEDGIGGSIDQGTLTNAVRDTTFTENSLVVEKVGDGSL